MDQHALAPPPDFVLAAQLFHVPPQVRCPIFWKPGLHEQKESVPLVTQWASSPSPQCVRLLLQSFSLVSEARQVHLEGTRSVKVLHMNIKTRKTIRIFFI